MRTYFENKNETNRSNSRFIDNNKEVGNIRVLSLNPYGYRLCNSEKLNILKQAIKKSKLIKF